MLMASLPLGGLTALAADVPADHWAAKALAYSVQQGYMQGDPDGNLRQDDSMSRAEYAVFLCRGLGLEPGGDHPFTDITEAYSWAEPYIAALYNVGIISGTSATTYDPGRTITREEVAVLMARAFKIPMVGGSNAFKDQGSISEWALSYVNAMFAAGLMVGDSSGNFNSQAPVTRAEVAQIIYNKEVVGLSQSQTNLDPNSNTTGTQSPDNNEAEKQVSTPSGGGGGGGGGGSSVGSNIPTATLNSAIADGVSGITSSTKIDLVFSQAIYGLTSNHITITNDTGMAVKGAISGSGTNWSIALSSVTVEGAVTITITNPAGYNISGSSKTVQVYKQTDFTVNSVTVTDDTTITLIFNKVPNPADAANVSNYILSGDALTRTSGGNQVNPDSASINGNIVTLTFAGASFNSLLNGETAIVDVSGISAVDGGMLGAPENDTFIKGAIVLNLLSATADGASGTTTSTKIDLVFDGAIIGLTAGDITITDGTGAAVKGMLSGGGTNWSINLSAVTTEGTVLLSVYSPAGYNITGKQKTINVYQDTRIPITFTAAQTGGTSGTADSTGIVLTFSQAVTGLTAGDITIANGTGAAVKGTLAGSGTSWTIALPSVTTQGNVTVSVANFGTFNVTTTPQTVAVYKDARIYPASVSVSIAAGSLLMPVAGGTCTISAAIDPASANTDTGITWSSSAPGVATVNSSGVVSAVGAGDANITATTGNSQTASIAVKVMPTVTGITFYTDKQTSGTVSYDMKVGATIPMYFPTLTPTGAYNVLTYSSSAPGIAQIIDNGDGSYSIKGLVAGSATITATSHNGMAHSFVINVKPTLTNAMIPASYTMNVNDSWTIPVTLTPASGAFGDYVLESSNPDVVRIEQNSRAYAVSPGTVTITAKIDGVTKSSCTVTVSPPALASSGNPELMYYNVTYQTNGKATVTLGIVPIAGAAVYDIYEHKAYNSSMTMAQLFDPSNIEYLGDVYQVDVADPFEITDTEPGLRFFSVIAYDSSNVQMGDVFLARVPVLYYPRNVGGANQAAADGVVVPFINICQQFVADLWGSGYFVGFPYYCDPYGVALTFDKIPGAAGYDVFLTNNGQDYGDDSILQPAGNRCVTETGFILSSGTAIFNILPYVYDIDGTTKLYGEMRTVIFNVQSTEYFSADYYYYWETPASLDYANLKYDM